ncbi:MAG: hypothetical protein NTX16_08950 [Actinobacteria bacterium]|nr:hypothetical protein [Actinomycetota bacterium]
MSHDSIRARLNLYAVLPNLEDVVREDPQMRALVSDARVTVRFVVANGPRAYVRFSNGVCTVGRGSGPEASGAAASAPSSAGPSVVLSFASASHLNKMFDGAGSPIPLWGFTRLGFLKNEFTELSDRMAYYLAPTEELLAHPGYLAMNTQLTLNTAAFAVPVLLGHDPDCMPLRHGLTHGTIVIKVLPHGPAVSLVCGASGVLPVKGALSHPSALVLLRDLPTASAFLNGKLDSFAAAVTGEVQIWGRIGMVDTLALVLDRVGKYLTPAAAPAATA